LEQLLQTTLSRFKLGKKFVLNSYASFHLCSNQLDVLSGKERFFFGFQLGVLILEKFAAELVLCGD